MDIWKHGKFVDMWSVVHLLSGFLLGGLFYALGSDFLWSLVYSAVILAVWELFEAATKIIEPSINVVFDLLIGLLGFSVAALAHFWFQVPFNLPLNVAVLIFTLTLALWGFLDFLKRGYR